MTRHPAALLAWHAQNHSVVWDILGDHRAGRDKAITTEGDTANDGRIGSNSGPASDQSLLVEGTPVHLRTRIADIGENAGRAEEDVIFNGCAGVDGDIVLNLHIVPNDHIIGHHCILAKNAILTNLGTGTDVGKMPNLSAVANGNRLVNDGGGMTAKTHQELLREIVTNNLNLLITEVRIHGKRDALLGHLFGDWEITILVA